MEMLRVKYFRVIYYLLLVIGINLGTVCAEESKPKTIGVLPFENQAGDQYSWLSSGISDTLIAKFTRTKGIRVVERERISNIQHGTFNDEVSPQSLISHRGTEGTEKTSLPKEKELRSKLALLGTEYLLIGSYTVLGDNIRINARIVHSETAGINGDTALTVKGKVADIFALETDLAEKFAKACGLEVAYNKLSYTDGKNTASYELFNRGKILFADGKYVESIDSFVKAQQQNDGFYFAEAHTREGKVRIALANAASDEQTKSQIQENHVKKFEKDAAEAASAFYDLGVALQACGQYEKAIKAYDDYLRWIDQRSKLLVNQIQTPHQKPIVIKSFVSSVKGSASSRYGFLDAGKLVVLIRDRLKSKLVSYDVLTGKVVWQTPLLGVGKKKMKPAPAEVVVTDTSYITFVEHAVYVVDRNSGNVICQSQPIGMPFERTGYIERSVHIDPRFNAGIVLLTFRPVIPARQRKCQAYHFSYSSGDIALRKVYNGECNYFSGIRESAILDGNLYFEDDVNGKCENFGFNIASAEPVKPIGRIARRHRRASNIIKDGNFVYKLQNGFLRKFRKGKANVLWQHKIGEQSKVIGIVDRLPVVSNPEARVFNVYNSGVRAGHLRTEAGVSLTRAVCLALLKKYEAAISSLKEVLAMDRAQREAFYWLGFSYSNLEQNHDTIFNGLNAFDSYSNESIADPVKHKITFDYLLKYGGIKEKKSFEQAVFYSVCTGEGRTLRVRESPEYRVYLPVVQRLAPLPRNTDFVDDIFYYLRSGNVIEAYRYDDNSLTSQCKAQGVIVGYVVENKQVFVAARTHGGYRLECFDVVQNKKLWDMPLHPEWGGVDNCYMISRGDKLLIATDNEFGEENTLLMVDAGSGRKLWDKIVPPNLIVMRGVHSNDKIDFENILFDGKNVLYSGAYSETILKIDGMSGKTLATHKATCDIVGFHECVADELVAFRYGDFLSVSKQDIRETHRSKPGSILTRLLGEKLVRIENGYSGIDYITHRRRSRSTSGLVLPIKRDWIDYSDAAVMAYWHAGKEVALFNKQTGELIESRFLDLKRPLSFFKHNDKLFMSRGNNYQSSGIPVMNLYEFDSGGLLPSWTREKLSVLANPGSAKFSNQREKTKKTSKRKKRSKKDDSKRIKVENLRRGPKSNNQNSRLIILGR